MPDLSGNFFIQVQHCMTVSRRNQSLPHALQFDGSRTTVKKTTV